MAKFWVIWSSSVGKGVRMRNDGIPHVSTEMNASDLWGSLDLDFSLRLIIGQTENTDPKNF